MNLISNKTNAYETQTPFHQILSGPNAFYLQPDYFETTKNDFASKRVLPPSFTWNAEFRSARIAKQIFSIIVFPIGIHQLLHALIGKIVIPSSTPTLLGLPKDVANQHRSEIPVYSDTWKYKRISIEVDGSLIDAVIVGKAKTLGNGRWMLASNGNGEFYESKLAYDHQFYQILNQIEGNGIAFNYPGVGASPGFPNRQATAKAYRALLHFLENQEKGIGAKEIIGYGHSIGGGVQGDALNAHQLKKEIKYVFIKSRSFSDLSTVVEHIMHKYLKPVVQFFGWNIGSIKSSKALQAPEIIMQTANIGKYEKLTSSAKIIHDGVIPAEATLGKALLNDPTCQKKNKYFLGIPDMHNLNLSHLSYLTDLIKKLLR